MSIIKNHLIDILATAVAGMPCMCREAMFLEDKAACDNNYAVCHGPCTLCSNILTKEKYTSYSVARMLAVDMAVSLRTLSNEKSTMRVYTVVVSEDYIARVYCRAGETAYIAVACTTDYVKTGLEDIVVYSILQKNGSPPTCNLVTYSEKGGKVLANMINTATVTTANTFGFDPYNTSAATTVRTKDRDSMVAVCAKFGMEHPTCTLSHGAVYTVCISFNDLFVTVGDDCDKYNAANDGKLTGINPHMCPRITHIVRRFMLPAWYTIYAAIDAWAAKQPTNTHAMMYVVPDPDDISRLYIRFFARNTTETLRKTRTGRKILAQLEDLAQHISESAWRVARNHFPPSRYHDILRCMSITLNHPPPRDAAAE